MTSPLPRKPRPPIRLHHSRILTEADRAIEEHIPVTALPRTLLDCAAESRFSQLQRMLERSEELKLFDLGPIEDLLERSGRHAGRVPLRRAIALYQPVPFTRSGFERLFFEAVLETGLPRPATNFVEAGFELDVYWPEQRFAVELDTYATHGTNAAFERDHVRDEDLTLAGIEIDPRHRRALPPRTGGRAEAGRDAAGPRVSGRAGAEVGRAREGAVEARPGLAGGELALEAVEAAEAAAEVVDHVDEDGLAGGGDDRGAVLELAVVAEDDVEDRLGEAGVEAGDVLDPAADQVVAERDLALQAAEIGEVDRQRVVVVGLGLADVVQEGAGDGDVAVDAGEEVGGGADRLGDRERVLEQPVAVGLVVGLGGRRVAEAGPGLAPLGEEGVEQLPQLRLLDRRQQGAQVRLEVLQRDMRLGRQFAGLVLVAAPPRAARRS